MIIIDIKKFNLFKLHYLLQVLIIIIIFVAMENKIADPRMENWKTGFIVIHLLSVTFDLLPIPGVLYEQMK